MGILFEIGLLGKIFVKKSHLNRNLKKVSKQTIIPGETVLAIGTVSAKALGQAHALFFFLH